MTGAWRWSGFCSSSPSLDLTKPSQDLLRKVIGLRDTRIDRYQWVLASPLRYGKWLTSQTGFEAVLLVYKPSVSSSRHTLPPKGNQRRGVLSHSDRKCLSRKGQHEQLERARR